MVQESQKTGFFSRLLGGLARNTTTKEVSDEKQVNPTNGTEVKPQDLKSEGILAKSLRDFKSIVAKGKALPEAEESAATLGKKQPESPKKGLPKPLLGIFVAVILLLVLSLIASKFATSLRKDKSGQDGAQIEPTPTPIDFRPYKPSVYAGDPKILALEEEVNVLDREVSSAILKDDSLKPPIVDFNINFKQ